MTSSHQQHVRTFENIQNVWWLGTKLNATKKYFYNIIQHMDYDCFDVVHDTTVASVLSEIQQLEAHDGDPTVPEQYARQLGLECNASNALRVLGDHLYYTMTPEQLVLWMERERFDTTQLRLYQPFLEINEPRFMSCEIV